MRRDKLDGPLELLHPGKRPRHLRVEGSIADGLGSSRFITCSWLHMMWG